MGVGVSPIRGGELVTVDGVGLDGLQEPSEILNCGNSGTTMRLMLGLLADDRVAISSWMAMPPATPSDAPRRPTACIDGSRCTWP